VTENSPSSVFIETCFCCHPPFVDGDRSLELTTAPDNDAETDAPCGGCGGGGDEEDDAINNESAADDVVEDAWMANELDVG
jgi:hypothetical protein